MISKDNGELYGSNGALSSFVSSMMKKADVDVDGGGISLLRHSKLSDLLRDATPTEREAIASLAAHSPMMSLSYIRKHKTELSTPLNDDEYVDSKRRAKRKAKKQSK